MTATVVPPTRLFGDLFSAKKVPIAMNVGEGPEPALAIFVLEELTTSAPRCHDRCWCAVRRWLDRPISRTTETSWRCCPSRVR